VSHFITRTCLVGEIYGYKFLSPKQALSRGVNTLFVLVSEVVYDSDTVTKSQLSLLFSIKIYIEKLYMYIFFMKVIFKTNLFI
jgi:hypothetical protein